MEVKFGVYRETSSLLSLAIDVAVERCYDVSRRNGLWHVCVPDWPAWLSCLWRAWAVLSRGSDADAMLRHYMFIVTLDKGWHGCIEVWYDMNTGGVRYGSVAM